MTVPWTEKYRPKRISEIVGNKAAVESFLKWMSGWETGRPSKKAALLYGPAGVGKTSTVYAYASERGYDVVEVNASDTRTKDKIESIIGSASQFSTIEGSRKKIILVDEVDGVDTKADSGGISALVKVVSETRIPIVLVANDPWDQRLAPLREKCEMIKYTRIHKASIASHIKKIADMEKLDISVDVIRRLAEKSEGDIRAAINDLQALASMGTVSQLPEAIGERDREEDIFKALAAVFNARNLKTAMTAINNVEMEPGELLTWVLDNAVEVYREPRHLSEALEYLARADMVLQKILKTQRWGLLKYFYALVSGVGLGGVGSRGMRFTYPSKIRYMAQSRARRETIDSISRKIAERCHLSTYKARKEMLPYVALLVRKDRDVAGFFGFDSSEVKYLAGEP
ncbi:hypothetical protein HRbin01_00443 [archaeon HR01]|nr:hypothetical protein HRbin01_00443 [archaeon HR01]